MPGEPHDLETCAECGDVAMRDNLIFCKDCGSVFCSSCYDQHDDEHEEEPDHEAG